MTLGFWMAVFICTMQALQLALAVYVSDWSHAASALVACMGWAAVALHQKDIFR